MTKAAELAKMGEVLTNSQIGGRRNIIINGAMQVAQRGTSVSSITSTGYRSLDRFVLDISSLGTWTMSQSTDVPSGQGFGNSLKLDCTTADASPSASDFMILNQRIEGYNLQALAKGSSSANPMTLSFWVKSTKTGTYVVEMYDNDNTRTFSKAYTISSADTWEKKTLTYDGDTTGTFDNDNNTSLQIFMWLGAGSNYTSGTISEAWGSRTLANAAAGQVNIADSTDNNFYITGVQLEVGSQATPFEHRSFGEELALCQRYFQKAGEYSIAPSNGSDGTSFSSFSEPLGNCVQWGGATAGNCPIYLPVRMRVRPTIVRYGNSSGYLGYIASGGSSPSSDNVLAFHQNLFLGSQTEQMIVINNQVTGSTIWGVMGGWTAAAEL